MPAPHKRVVIDQNGALIYRILYTSEHTGDVFFFYKGVNQQKSGDFTGVNDDQAGDAYNIGFLKLDLTETEIAIIGDGRNLSEHCIVESIDDESILKAYLHKLLEKDLDDQN